MRKKESKYHAQKCVVNGIVFDSKKEAKTYQELSLLERAGKITGLKRQVRYELIPAQREPDIVGARGGIKKGKIIEHAVCYYADFQYVDESGNTVVVDTKGIRTKEYIIKRKLMLYVHGIKIKEI